MRRPFERRRFLRRLAGVSLLPIAHPASSALSQLGMAANDGGIGSRGQKGPRRPFGEAQASILFGAWEPGPVEAVDALSRALGRPLDIVHWYQGWGAEDSSFDLKRARLTAERGALPLITWEPWDYRQGREQPRFRLRNIADGRFDTYVRTMARSLRAFGQPLLLRFAHEMNGTAYPWSVGANGNLTTDYVSAWRHVVNVVRDESANNVAFAWSPLVPSPGSAPLADCFPGDQYIDVIGMDGYNAGTAADWGGWLSLTQVFGGLYDAVTSLSDRPVIIAETACAEEGGSKPAWIADGFLRELPQRFPAVAAVVWFNERREANWRLDSAEATLEVARTVFTSGPFATSSPLPGIAGLSPDPPRQRGASEPGT